jgi:hypothetical protein
MENFAKNQWGSNSYSTLLKKLRTMDIYIYLIKYLMILSGEPWSKTLRIALIFGRDICFGF